MSFLFDKKFGSEFERKYFPNDLFKLNSVVIERNDSFILIEKVVSTYPTQLFEIFGF